MAKGVLAKARQSVGGNRFSQGVSPAGRRAEGLAISGATPEAPHTRVLADAAINGDSRGVRRT